MTKPKRPVYYPIYLDLNDRKTVIIGGGGKAVKKALSRIETQAHIVVITDNPINELCNLANKKQITLVNRSYKNGDLKDAFMVIVMDTSDSSINRAVHKEAANRNIV